jgi:WD40 repeat protein
VRFDAWNTGHVAASTHEVPLDLPRQTNLVLETVSPRLKQELIHPNRNSTLVGLHFSADGTRLIAGDYPGGVVTLWDLPSGKQLSAIETGYGTRGTDQYFFVSADWRKVFVSHEKRKVHQVEDKDKRTFQWQCDGDVCVWNLDTGRLERTYKHSPPRGILGMELLPDGNRFVTFDELSGTGDAGKRVISFWDVASGHHRTLPAEGSYWGYLSPNGHKLLARVTDAKGTFSGVKLYNLDDCREVWSIPVDDRRVMFDVGSFSPNGCLLVAGYRVFPPGKKYRGDQTTWDSWFKWYDTATGKEVASFPGAKKDSLYNAQFSPDGRSIAVASLAAWAAQTEFFLFSVPEKKLLKTIHLGVNTKEQRLVARRPVYSPDGRWLAVITQVFPETRGDVDARDLAQARIHLVEAATGEIRETLIAPQGVLGSACFSPDGRTLATGGLGRVLLWALSKQPGELIGAKTR